RAAVDEDTTGKPLEALVATRDAAGYERGGDRLKTKPRGVADDQPRLDLVRHRSLHAGRRLAPDPRVHTPEVAAPRRACVRDVGPLVDWLCTHVRGSELPGRP